MTKKYLISFLLLVVNFCFCQEKTMLFFKDGSTKTGMYKIRKKTFTNDSSNMVILNNDTDEKYTLDDITVAIVFKNSLEYYYEVINVKKNFNDKKTEKKLGLLAYKSPKINMYYIAEAIYSGGTVGMGMMYGTNEKYVQKSKDSIAYNLGYIYGAGERGIKKRVRDYFTDCPNLVELVDNNKIEKYDTLQIIKYYEDNCAE
ncbi:MAG: hypothetical protein RLZZ540_2690 [Bacteroidota bacterium]